MSVPGNSCLPRQVLTTMQKGLSQQEEIVQLPLLALGGVAFIGSQLLVAKTLYDFPFLACVPKGSPLLIPQIFQTCEFAFES